MGSKLTEDEKAVIRVLCKGKSISLYQAHYSQTEYKITITLDLTTDSVRKMDEVIS